MMKNSCITVVFSSIHSVKASKYGVISGPYFPVFGLNTGKYPPQISPYLDTFQTKIFYKTTTEIHNRLTINFRMREVKSCIDNKEGRKVILAKRSFISMKATYGLSLRIS